MTPRENSHALKLLSRVLLSTLCFQGLRSASISTQGHTKVRGKKKERRDLEEIQSTKKTRGGEESHRVTERKRVEEENEFCQEAIVLLASVRNISGEGEARR